MPLDHQVDEEHNLLVSRATGELDVASLLSYMESVRQEKRLRPGYRSFVDLSGADLCRVDAHAVRRAAEVVRRFEHGDEPVRVAFLAPQDVAFGLARMYGVLVESLRREVGVFRDAAAAYAWLGLSEPEADPA
jgi:hypothetical protein